MTNPKTPKKSAATATATPENTKPRKRRATPTGVSVVLPRSPGHHYGSQRHYAMLETGDVLYVGTQHKLMELEVIDTGKKAEPRPELGKGTYLTIRTVADELEVDGETVKNAEVLLYCEPDTRIAVKSRY